MTSRFQDARSVHFLPLPTVEDSLFNKEIERKVSAMQKVIQLSRTVRERHNIARKTPLLSLVVIADEQVLCDVQSSQSYVKEELNVLKLPSRMMKRNMYPPERQSGLANPRQEAKEGRVEDSQSSSENNTGPAEAVSTRQENCHRWNRTRRERSNHRKSPGERHNNRSKRRGRSEMGSRFLRRYHRSRGYRYASRSTHGDCDSGHNNAHSET